MEVYETPFWDPWKVEREYSAPTNASEVGKDWAVIDDIPYEELEEHEKQNMGRVVSESLSEEECVWGSVLELVDDAEKAEKDEGTIPISSAASQTFGESVELEDKPIVKEQKRNDNTVRPSLNRLDDTGGSGPQSELSGIRDGVKESDPVENKKLAKPQPTDSTCIDIDDTDDPIEKNSFFQKRSSPYCNFRKHVCCSQSVDDSDRPQWLKRWFTYRRHSGLPRRRVRREHPGIECVSRDNAIRSCGRYRSDQAADGIFNVPASLL